jgi:undecaprenyl-diphosphatase
MPTLFQAVTLGLVQGIAELFPISSLGHSVLLPGLLGWNINQNGNAFLTFLVATHFATAIVLFVFYWKDWVGIIKGIFSSLAAREISNKDPLGKLGWLLIASTIPAGVIGVLFQDQIRSIFLSPLSAAFFLVLNGLLLLIAERLRRNAQKNDIWSKATVGAADTRIATELSWWQAIKVGLLQVIALIPGFSRTGATLSGGLMVGLTHEDSLRYSFLLATPIIGAAALLELPSLFTSNTAMIEITLAGALAAAIAAYFSVNFLTQYFKTKTLKPFALYCILVGLFSLIVLNH